MREEPKNGNRRARETLECIYCQGVTQHQGWEQGDLLARIGCFSGMRCLVKLLFEAARFLNTCSVRITCHHSRTDRHRETRMEQKKKHKVKGTSEQSIHPQTSRSTSLHHQSSRLHFPTHVDQSTRFVSDACARRQESRHHSADGEHHASVVVVDGLQSSASVALDQDDLPSLLVG